MNEYEIYVKGHFDRETGKGGGWTDPTWHWSNIYENYNKYSEEELYLLYTRIKKKLEDKL